MQEGEDAANDCLFISLSLALNATNNSDEKDVLQVTCDYGSCS